jgi:hypothetical protein
MRPAKIEKVRPEHVILAIIMNDHDLLESLKQYHSALSRGRAAGGLADLRKHGYAYSDWAEWLLRNGRVMEPVRGPWPPPEQAFIDSMTGRSYFDASECFANAQKALLFWLMDTEVRGSGNKIHLTYCEGCAAVPCVHPLPYLHAWLLLNGKVWDPTNGPNARKTARLGRNWDPPTSYVGAEFDPAFILRRMVENRGWVSVLDLGKPSGQFSATMTGANPLYHQRSMRSCARWRKPPWGGNGNSKSRRTEIGRVSIE